MLRGRAIKRLYIDLQEIRRNPLRGNSDLEADWESSKRFRIAVKCLYLEAGRVILKRAGYRLTNY